MDTKPDYSFSTLTPDCVLNALESLGLRSDGRLLALNSYENRVYQSASRRVCRWCQVLPPGALDG